MDDHNRTRTHSMKVKPEDERKLETAIVSHDVHDAETSHA